MTQDRFSDAVELADGPEDAGMAAAVERVREILVEGERLDGYAPQRRIFALVARRAIVVATSGRCLIIRRNLISGFVMQDIRWQDVVDVQLEEGTFASTLTISTQDGTVHRVGGLRKAAARRVYVLCQAQEQAWREKNRVREMEEARARAGGVHVGTSPVHIDDVGAAAGTASDAPAARLQRAKELLDQGLISDAEYESVKAKVLSDL
jgi:hypothetical protein